VTALLDDASDDMKKTMNVGQCRCVQGHDQASIDPLAAATTRVAVSSIFG